MRLTIVGKGMMGSLLVELAKELMETGEEILTVDAIDLAMGDSFYNITEPDVIIDFSHPDSLNAICQYVETKEGRVGVVFGTTGYSQAQIDQIHDLAKVAPVIQSYNYSYGIYALKKLLGCAASMMGERSDIEITEKHHNCKMDAPSGTAFMLADICDPAHQRNRIFGREGAGKRGNEIGIHSLRGGTIFGEHNVMFALPNEVIEISHTAFSKKIFAKGALEAAIWLNGKNKGIYTIEDVFY